MNSTSNTPSNMKTFYTCEFNEETQEYVLGKKELDLNNPEDIKEAKKFHIKDTLKMYMDALKSKKLDDAGIETVMNNTVTLYEQANKRDTGISWLFRGLFSWFKNTGWAQIKGHKEEIDRLIKDMNLNKVISEDNEVIGKEFDEEGGGSEQNIETQNQFKTLDFDQLMKLHENKNTSNQQTINKKTFKEDNTSGNKIKTDGKVKGTTQKIEKESSKTDDEKKLDNLMETLQLNKDKINILETKIKKDDPQYLKLKEQYDVLDDLLKSFKKDNNTLLEISQESKKFDELDKTFKFEGVTYNRTTGDFEGKNKDFDQDYEDTWGEKYDKVFDSLKKLNEDFDKNYNSSKSINEKYKRLFLISEKTTYANDLKKLDEIKKKRDEMKKELDESKEVLKKIQDENKKLNNEISKLNTIVMKSKK